MTDPRAEEDFRRDEWHYRYDERLGILAGNDKPTDAQKAIAKQEADAWYHAAKQKASQ